VSHKFQDEVLADGAVRIFGNVTIGEELTLEMLRNAYDAVFLCHGTSESKHLSLASYDMNDPDHALVQESVPYGGLEGTYLSAEQVVGWYNGDLQYTDLKMDLSSVKNVTLIGAGNVALDIARLLLKDPVSLEETDITRPALEVLKNSAVETVNIVARRGAQYAAFTTKELRELSLLPQVKVSVSPSLEELDESKLERPLRRMLKLLKDMAARPPPPADEGGKELSFVFESPPNGFLTNGRVHYLLAGDKQVKSDIVVSCVGYQMRTLDDTVAPLDGSRIINDRGRITKGLYVTGWAKRGPSGIVPSNKWDAVETVASFVEDAIEPEKTGVIELPSSALSLDQMDCIERAEKRRKQGKFCSFDEMKQIISKD
jgi:NADPH-dependent glutamate synthase beta subunit-like oxidoreductase